MERGKRGREREEVKGGRRGKKEKAADGDGERERRIGSYRGVRKRQKRKK